MTIDLERDYRLINASIAAGMIGKPSSEFENSPYLAKAGLRSSPQIFVHGDRGIDAAFLGERREGGYILAFRGTLTRGETSDGDAICLDWTQDRKYDPAPWAIQGQDAGTVAQGFSDAMESLWAGASLGGAIGEIYRRDPNASLWITGHSKGGALSILAASLVVTAHFRAPVPEVVTFAAPRVGNLRFVLIYDTAGHLAGHTDRYQNQYDLVPMVPAVHLNPIPGTGCDAMSEPFGPIGGFVPVGRLTYIYLDEATGKHPTLTGQAGEDGYRGSLEALLGMDPNVATGLSMAAHDPKGGYLLCFDRDRADDAVAVRDTPWARARAET